MRNVQTHLCPHHSPLCDCHTQSTVTECCWTTENWTMLLKSTHYKKRVFLQIALKHSFKAQKQEQLSHFFYCTKKLCQSCLNLAAVWLETVSYGVGTWVFSRFASHVARVFALSHTQACTSSSTHFLFWCNLHFSRDGLSVHCLTLIQQMCTDHGGIKRTAYRM